MSRRIRKWIRVTVIVLFAAIAILATLLFGIREGWMRERITRGAERVASEALDGSVRIGSIEGPLWPDLVLHELTVESDGVAVHLERAELRLRFEGWPAERLVIERVHLVRPTISSSEAGATGPPDPDVAASPAAPFSLEIEHGTIDRGRILGTTAGTLGLEGRVEHFVLSGDDRSLPETLDLVLRSLDPQQGFEFQLGRPDGGSIDARFRWMQSGLEVRGEGTIDPAAWLAGDQTASIEWNAEVLDLDPSLLFERDDLASRLTGQARGSAVVDLEQFDRSAVEATLRLVAPEGSAIANIAGDFGISGGRWSVDRLDATGRELVVRGKGNGDLQAIENLALRVEIPNLNHWSGTPAGWITGGLVANLVARGPFDAPIGRLEAESRALRIGGSPETSTARLELEATEDRWQIRAARLDGPHGRFEVAPAVVSVGPDRKAHFEGLTLRSPGGELQLDGAVAMNPNRLHGVLVRTSSFDLATLAPLVDLPWLSGVIEGQARLDGDPAAPELQGRMHLVGADGAASIEGGWSHGQLRDVRVELDEFVLAPWAEMLGSSWPGNLTAQLVISGTLDDPNLEGEMHWRSGASAAHWEGDLRGAAFGEARLRLVDLDLATIVPAQISSTPLEGRLAADVTLRGPIRSPAVSGSMTWAVPGPQGEVRALRGLLAGDEIVLRANGSVHERGIELGGFELAIPYPIDATTLNHPAFAGHLRADGLDLALLAPFLPGLLRKPAGRVEGTIKVRGGSPEPRVDGRLTLRGGAFDVPALGQRFHPIDAEIELTNGAVEIRSLRAGPPAGAARGSGRLELDGLAVSELQLKASLDKLALSRAASLKTNLSGQASIEGPPSHARLRGEFTLGDARIAPPEPDDPLLREIRIQGMGSARSEIRRQTELAGESSLDIDLALIVPPGTWIRGQGAELEAEGRLRYSQRPGEPGRYDGKLRTVRGSYRLQGRTLTVDRGTLTFGGQTDFDPDLDVAASARVGAVTLLVTLAGRLSNPQVVLSSDPILPQSDVIALLVLGRTTAELDRSESTGVQGIIAGAGATIAVDKLRALVGENLPFDTAGVEMGNDGTPSRVQIGRYVGEKLFVQYGRSLASEADDEVRVEWKLTPNIRVESSATSAGEAGADAVWSIEY